MYEELIKLLREDAEDGYLIYTRVGDDVAKAADAIEELQKVANKLLAKYQEEAESMIWEYSGHIDESMDYLHKEIRGLQAQIDGKQKTPKEE